MVSAFALAVASAEELLVSGAADSLPGLDVLDEPEPLGELVPDVPSSELDPLEEAAALGELDPLEDPPAVEGLDALVGMEPPMSELPTLLSVDEVLWPLSAAVIGAVRALSADPADVAGAESWVDPATD